MGQANAARDSLYDLRECRMTEANAGGFDISGALMGSGDFSKTDFKEAQLSKVRMCACVVAACRAGRCWLCPHISSRSLLRGRGTWQVFAPEAKFDGADFTNGIIDRAFFKGSSFVGTKFNNAVLSGTSFDEADLTDADFTDAYIGQFDLKRLCKNAKLTGENPKTGAPTRESAGCTGAF